MTFCCDFLWFEEDVVYARTTPGIKYVHKKDEWLGYGDYAVVLVSGNFSPASAINKWVQGSELAASIFAGAQDGRLFSLLTTHTHIVGQI
jgi:hypothetical protein